MNTDLQPQQPPQWQLPKLPGTVVIDDFSVLDNVQRVSTLRVIQNMRVTTDRRLEKREGYTLWIPLPGAHSLWRDHEEGSFYCSAHRPGSESYHSLWRISPDGDPEELTEISGVDEPLYFVKGAGTGRIYVSSRTWNGVIETLDGPVRARDWGSLYTDDPAELSPFNSEEELLLGSTEAPLMENLCLTGGRIFGSVGNRVYYNDPPMAYELYRPDSFVEFDEEIVMIAYTSKNGMYTREGMFFASLEKTWFATGFDPEDWELKVVGKGAIPGTLQYIPDFKEFNNVPVWLTNWGVHAGVNGIIQQVTGDRVRLQSAGRAASMFRLTGGGEYLASFIQPPDVGFGDRVTCDVVRNGKLIY